MLSGTFLVVLTTLHLHHHAAVSVGDSITAAVAQSPLFGSSELGQPFDDGTTTVTPPVARLQSLSIAYGSFIFGIQATYLLENGGKFSGDIHRTIDPHLARMNSTVLQLIFITMSEFNVSQEHLNKRMASSPCLSCIQIIPREVLRCMDRLETQASVISPSPYQDPSPEYLEEVANTSMPLVPILIHWRLPLTIAPK